MMNLMKTLLLGLASAGWLYPAYLSHVWSAAAQNPGNSFPYAQSSDRAFAVACIWLGVTIVIWSRFFLRQRAKASITL